MQSASALHERFTLKSTDELRAIAAGSSDDYMPEARETAAAILAERDRNPETVDPSEAMSAPNASSKSSVVAKVLSVFAAMVVIRELLRWLAHYFFR